MGELARASGLSIRTVRYYDQIRLLTPSRRSASGHRSYDDADVRRLYRICFLRRAGLARGGQAEAGRDLVQPDPAVTRLHLAVDAVARVVVVEAALGEHLGAATGTTAVMVEDVDAHHARAVEAGADIVYPPTDQPYGFREYSARDPEGACGPS